ncbi:hypothetical protein JZ751_019192 [Albula glossodonta]|uniref:Uncharacterized protein n=1 Tax=Albula glossodonta TaxID=121402 RepID=A0A8T2NLZ1_9TELE|nr:hypothetical protein JZ751_019192 [Albula glossodonta]
MEPHGGEKGRARGAVSLSTGQDSSCHPPPPSHSWGLRAEASPPGMGSTMQAADLAPPSHATHPLPQLHSDSPATASQPRLRLQSFLAAPYHKRGGDTSAHVLSRFRFPRPRRLLWARWKPARIFPGENSTSESRALPGLGKERASGTCPHLNRAGRICVCIRLFPFRNESIRELGGLRKDSPLGDFKEFEQDAYLLRRGSSILLPSWDSWLLLRVRVMFGRRCRTFREGGGGVQGGLSRCRRLEGGVMGGVAACPWMRPGRGEEGVNGSESPSEEEGAADVDTERGCGLQGVEGLEGVPMGRASGEGLWDRRGTPGQDSWSTAARVPLSLRTGSVIQAPPGPKLNSTTEQNLSNSNGCTTRTKAELNYGTEPQQQQRLHHQDQS